MDSHDEDLNLSDIVEPRTEAERLELEEAVAQVNIQVVSHARDRWRGAVCRGGSRLG